MSTTSIDYTMTLQGRVNRYSHIDCQDYTSRAVYKDVTALALCDGAGSLRLCRVGAQAMSTAFSKWIARDFRRLMRTDEREIIRESVRLIEYVLAALEVKYDEPERSFGSTLLVGACDERGHCLLLHLGDGIIAGIDQKDHLVPLSAPEGTGNATYLTCCSSDLLHKHLRVYKPKGIRSLFMTSDGAKDILYTTDLYGLRLSTEISSLTEQLKNDRSGFEHCFPSFVDASIRPLDDFSVAMLLPAQRAAFAPHCRHGQRRRSKARFAAALSRSASGRLSASA